MATTRAEPAGADAIAPDAVAADEGSETIELVDRARGPTTIGRYELCYHLASGGMASVFLARAVGPAGFWKPVALKRIHPHLARRKDFVAMFLDEARIAARIDHPNVCAVHDFGEADATYYLAMEYLVGVPLIRLIASMEREARAGRGRWSEPRWHALAARVIADAAEGLHAAHELKDTKGEPLGVVHRDVSPQNVFVTFDGAVKVVDFGIALARDRVQETETGTLKGKLGYMAPEQASSGAIDRRADVWALGVCLWEMLAGARLFRRASPMETLKAVGEATIEPPSSRRPGVPAELDRIVLRALSRDREGRQPTARALARELQAFVRASGEPTALSDLAEWMEPLFSSERAQKSEIVHTVLHAPDVSTALRAKSTGSVVGAPASDPPLADPGRVGAKTASLQIAAPADGDTQPLAAITAPLAAITIPTDAVPANDVDTQTLPRRSRAGAWIAGASVLALAALGVTWAIDSQPDTAAPPTTTLPAAAPLPVPAPVAADSAPVSVPSPDPDPDPVPDPGPVPTTRRPRDRDVPRPATTIDPGNGWVTVAAVGGWADVYEGTRHLGQTPIRVQLRAGRHTLVVRPFGRTDDARRMPVTITRDQTASLVVPVR